LDKAPEAFRTISEVADELEVPKHVLRFWEAKFAQLKPMKRGGGRRYYRPEDVALLRGIRFLLYNDGYTIRGVQKILREHGPRFVMDYRRMAEDAGEDEAMSTPHEIPDIAAEAAQGGAQPFPRQPAGEGIKLDRQKLGRLLEEIEACHRVLVEARD
jgi:DNA-binding transcriptional MerR regulator